MFFKALSMLGLLRLPERAESALGDTPNISAVTSSITLFNPLKVLTFSLSLFCFQ